MILTRHGIVVLGHYAPAILWKVKHQNQQFRFIFAFFLQKFFTFSTNILMLEGPEEASAEFVSVLIKNSQKPERLQKDSSRSRDFIAYKWVVFRPKINNFLIIFISILFDLWMKLRMINLRYFPIIGRAHHLMTLRIQWNQSRRILYHFLIPKLIKNLCAWIYVHHHVFSPIVMSIITMVYYRKTRQFAQIKPV